jgi:hypothetical protein
MPPPSMTARPGHPIEGPSFCATPLSSVVAADLEAVFLKAPSLRKNAGSADDLAARTPVRRKIFAFPEKRTSRSSPATLGVIAAAALVGLGAGAMMKRSVASAAGPATAAQTVPSYYVSTLPAPPPIRLDAEPIRMPVAASAPIISETGAQASKAKAKPARTTKAAAASRSRTEDSGAACGQSRRSANACRYDQVLAADRRLRQVYQRAVRAGVSHAVLVDYRDAWSQASRRAAKNPQSAVRRYEALGEELEAYADRARRAEIDDASFTTARR